MWKFIGPIVFCLSAAAHVFMAKELHCHSKKSLFSLADERRVVPTSYLIPDQVDSSIEAYLIRQINLTATATRIPIASNVTSVSINPLKECSPTSQVRLQVATTNTGIDKWTVHAIDAKGNGKRVGGDEFYITYEDQGENTTHTNTSMGFGPTAVAIITDNNDGSYSLEFVTPPSRLPNPANITGVGRITVHFDFTCGIGKLYQPTKDSWRTGGGTKILHSLGDIKAPPIREFKPPNQTNSTDSVDLDRYEKIYVAGDSTLRQMVGEDVNGGHKAYSDKIHFWYSPSSDLSSDTMPDILNNVEKKYGPSLLGEGKEKQDRGEITRMATAPSKTKAIILSSGPWDVLLQGKVQGPDFTDHLDTCRRYVTTVRDKYPSAEVMWKLPSQLHFHTINTKCLDDDGTGKNVDENGKVYAGPWGGNIACINVIRYLSSSRIRYLYEEQKDIMQELAVPVIDIYEASVLSGHEHNAGDSIHYSSRFNKRALDWYGINALLANT